MRGLARGLIALGGACCLATAAAAHDVEVRVFNLPSAHQEIDGSPIDDPAVADVTYWSEDYDRPSGQTDVSISARSPDFGGFEYGAEASEDSEPIGRYRLRDTGLAGGFGIVSRSYASGHGVQRRYVDERTGAPIRTTGPDYAVRDETLPFHRRQASARSAW